MLLLSLLLFVFTVQNLYATKWELTWEENFSGTSLNHSRWNTLKNQTHCCGPRLPWPFNKVPTSELELYIGDEVNVKDGNLEISTHARRYEDQHGKIWNFTSGWIDTKDKFSQMYGRFEANCSLPSRNNEGIWPAFWLMPQKGIFLLSFIIL